jgi:hypothetical protein
LVGTGNRGEAPFAIALAALGTFPGAASTQIAVATLAEGHTIAAQRPVAPITVRFFVRAHLPAAITAGDSAPVAQANMGAVGVVGLQHLPHEDKEIEQPARTERSFDSCGSIPFAEKLSADVWMRDVRFVIRRIGIVGNYLVGPLLANPLPFEHDPKRPQSAAFEHDGGRPDTDDLVAQIKLALLEFIRQGRQIGSDLARCGDRVITGRLRQAQPELAQLTHESLEDIIQIEMEMVAGGTPSSLLGNPQPGDCQDCLFPQAGREIVQVGGSCRTDQLLVNLDGSAHQHPSLFAIGVHRKPPRGVCEQDHVSSDPDRRRRTTERLRS